MAKRLKCNNFSDTKGLFSQNQNQIAKQRKIYICQQTFVLVFVFVFGPLPFGKIVLNESPVPEVFAENRIRIWQSLSNKFFDVFALTTPWGMC